MAQSFGSYNLVATFEEIDRAHRAISGLLDNGFDAEQVHLLTRNTEDDNRAAGTHDEVDDFAASVTGGAAKGAAIGGGLGGIAGFLAGAIAFAIPGAGPVLGTGVWAATAAGATAGATAGGFAGGFKKTWETYYLDSVKSGASLVSVHTDDEAAADRARDILRDAGAAGIDHLDEGGEIVTRE